MGTINQIKQLAETDTPLLFFQCTLPSGDTAYWSTHSIQFNGQSYAAKGLETQPIRFAALGRRRHGRDITTLA